MKRSRRTSAMALALALVTPTRACGEGPTSNVSAAELLMSETGHFAVSQTSGQVFVNHGSITCTEAQHKFELFSTSFEELWEGGAEYDKVDLNEPVTIDVAAPFCPCGFVVGRRDDLGSVSFHNIGLGSGKVDLRLALTGITHIGTGLCGYPEPNGTNGTLTGSSVIGRVGGGEGT